MMIRLTYASRATNLGPMDIKDILASSRRNNQQLGVTGSLCLCNGIFLQCLEGDRTVVNTLYHKILVDKRHRGSQIIGYEEIVKRMFTTWAMGLIPSNNDNVALFLKYSTLAEFDPFAMSSAGLKEFFQEALDVARMLN